MTQYVSSISPVTGKQEWHIQKGGKNDDTQPPIRDSIHLDLLRDSEIAEKYKSAIQKAIACHHARGEAASVVCVGPDCVLQSMVAARAGADFVTLCDMPSSVLSCVTDVIASNGYSGRIQVVGKPLQGLTVGPGGELPTRATVLVLQRFDGSLLGGGCLEVFRQAHTKLLTRGCTVVPTGATVYAQLVGSEWLGRFHQFQTLHGMNGLGLKPPVDVSSCPGSGFPQHLHLDQVPRDMFTPLSKPVSVFRFDFSQHKLIRVKEHIQKTIEVTSSGRCDVLFLWWQLQMDPENTIRISTAPNLSQGDPDIVIWRDEWKQAVYYPRKSMIVRKGQRVLLHGSHDSQRLWFELSRTEPGPDSLAVQTYGCHCGVHAVCDPSRIAMMNTDSDTRRKYIQILQEVVRPDSVCVNVGDMCLLPLIAAQLGAAKVYALEPKPWARHLIQNYVKENGLADKVRVLDKRPEELLSSDVDGHGVALLMGEPYFTSSRLPWHNLCFWYSRTELSEILTDGVTILPRQASLKAIAVCFTDLGKLRTPVDQCLGFNFQSLDRLIQNDVDNADNHLKTYPLWQYQGFPLCDQFDILNMDFTRPLQGIRTVERDGFIEFRSSGSCTGVAVWIEYRLDKDTVVSAGLLEPPQFGQSLQWSPYHQQAVQLFPQPHTVDISQSGPAKWRLKHKLVFKPGTGEMNIQFAVHND